MKFGDATQAQLKAISQIQSVPALKAGADVFFQEMQNLTPVDKGDLKDSEAVVIENDTVSLTAGTDHAIPVEFGTYKMPAQSYMRAALDNKANEALQVMGQVVQKEIKEAAG